MELDLRERPFTEPRSRLLVMAADDGSLWVARALYETPPTEAAVLTGLRVFAGDRELAVRRALPWRVDFDEGVTLAFADPDTLVLSTTCGGTFRVVWDGGSASLGDSLTLVGQGSFDPETVLAAAEARWRDWLARMPAVPEDLQDIAETAWWTLGVNILHIQGGQALVPAKNGYVGLWNWDALFHAVGLRHGHPGLAREQIRLLLAHQRPDGQLPDVIHDHGVLAETADLPRSDIERMDRHVGGGAPRDPVPVTKPPLAAWAVWKVHEAAPDPAFLAEVYEPLVRAQRWWFACSDPDGDGLAEYLHPYSSGLDDSPIWDLGPRAEPPDLNSYLALQADCLADIADALGRREEAARWRRDAQALVDLMVARRWSGDRFVTLSGGRVADVRTPLELMPLVTGRLPGPVADRLVADLTSPSFWAPVPSVAFDDPRFDPEAMWRGPVWLNVNHLLIEGLHRSGHPDVADRLAGRVLAMVRDGGGLYEYWNPLTGARAKRAAAGFGWSAALFLDLAAGR
ncbi:amylo-alpha-1,6-glucosidase [Thermoactinospora rubra]|uniref:amylo-alpha-1,6-glucosidase n=1 Tax=Thermoactinospora rubra TaxID=1088767 RepID=UPI00117F04D8|nr:glycogen debranching protein [Thermoactinospora rubra]